MFKLIPDKQILNINLKNEALEWYGHYQGIYHLSLNKTNEKPSWESATHAIWSFEDHMNTWVIGELNDMGDSYKHQKIHGVKGNKIIDQSFDKDIFFPQDFLFI